MIDWLAGGRATLMASYQPQVPAMLLNRLNSLSFLPSASANAASGASLGAEASKTALGLGSGAADLATQRLKKPALDKPDTAPLAAPAQEGVVLNLDYASKAGLAGTYTKDGRFSNLSNLSDLPRTTPLTPAEEFVAAAVVNLKNYEQAKTNAIVDAAAKLAAQATANAQGRFDSIKQAVSKLYS